VNDGPPGDPVARLATEVASLRRGVTDLSTKVDDVEQLRANVDQLSEGVADLASRVSRLVSSPSLEAQPRPYWLAALQGERLERAWRELAQWVEDVVVGRYQRSVKPCWYRHALAVDVLAACYMAWSAAYLEEAVPTAPAEWHDRWFPHLMRLVDADTKACKARKHEVDEELAPSMHEPHELDAFIKESVRAASAR
jgi:X-X-X-Leu-X-X-Gly heptad repeat protein